MEDSSREKAESAGAVVMSFPSGQAVNMESLFPLVDKHVRIKVDVSSSSETEERQGVLYSVDTQAHTLLLLQSNRICSALNVDTVRQIETCTPPSCNTEAGTDTDTTVELLAKLAIERQKNTTTDVGDQVAGEQPSSEEDQANKAREKLFAKLKGFLLPYRWDGGARSEVLMLGGAARVVWPYGIDDIRCSNETVLKRTMKIWGEDKNEDTVDVAECNSSVEVGPIVPGPVLTYSEIAQVQLSNSDSTVAPLVNGSMPIDAPQAVSVHDIHRLNYDGVTSVSQQATPHDPKVFTYDSISNSQSPRSARDMSALGLGLGLGLDSQRDLAPFDLGAGNLQPFDLAPAGGLSPFDLAAVEASMHHELTADTYGSRSVFDNNSNYAGSPSGSEGYQASNGIGVKQHDKHRRQRMMQEQYNQHHFGQQMQEQQHQASLRRTGLFRTTALLNAHSYFYKNKMQQDQPGQRKPAQQEQYEAFMELQEMEPDKGIVDRQGATPKYWNQRYRLFSLFDEGIKMDAELWYSVTPEAIAEHIGERCRCDYVMDPFTGGGGNVIQFAFASERVLAVEIDADKIAMARHNAEVYKVDDRIEFVQGNAMQVLKNMGDMGTGKTVEVIFLSPPWGGPEYQSVEKLKLRDMRFGKNYNCEQVLKLCLQITPNVAYFLPRNIDADNLWETAVGYGATVCELEAHLIKKKGQPANDSKIKTYCAYFGEWFQEPFEG